MAGATMRQKFFVRFFEELKKQKIASEIMGYMIGLVYDLY